MPSQSIIFNVYSLSSSGTDIPLIYAVFLLPLFNEISNVVFALTNSSPQYNAAIAFAVTTDSLSIFSAASFTANVFPFSMLNVSAHVAFKSEIVISELGTFKRTGTKGSSVISDKLFRLLFISLIFVRIFPSFSTVTVIELSE